MNFDEDIMIAIMFNFVNTDENYPVYFPVKPMIGRVSEDNNVFTDILTGRKVLSVDKIVGIDGEVCFSMLANISTLLKDTNESVVENAIRKLWQNVDGRAFVYAFVNEDLSNPMMLPLADEYFNDLFGYSIESEVIGLDEYNKLIEEFASGNISKYEYSYFLEYHEFPGKGKCKIINVDFSKQ